MNTLDTEKHYDPEVVLLCRALNRLPGIRTIESCMGHGEHPLWIFFVAKDLDSLAPVCYFANGCHSGCYNWQVEVNTDCVMSPVTFLLEGEDPTQADTVAAVINEYCDDVGE